MKKGKKMSVVVESLVSIDPSGVWVARCPALRVGSQGRTEHEAELALASAVALLYIHAQRRGVDLATASP